MIRPHLDKGFIILNKDLEKKSVQKKRYKEFTEYWIYRVKKEKGNIYLPSGRKNILQAGKTYLYAIIVCETNHISKKEKDRFWVKGIKFTEEHIKQYLSKTERGTVS